jgi:hypothetical protein
MTKSLLLTVILMSCAPSDSFACEICGCGNSNFQIGILPTFNKGFIGLRYGASQFNSTLRDDATQFSRDHFKTMELWGGYNAGKWQVMGFVPYVFSRKESDDGLTVSNGPGDLLLLINYRLLGSAALSADERTTLRNDLYVGGGIKLPTGTNSVDVNNPDFNIGDFNSQAGTGSVDYIFNATHNLAWNKNGIITNAAYRINTANRQEYKFGNRIYLNAAYYRSYSTSEVQIKPSAGFNYQRNAVNTFIGSEVVDSNGYNLNGTVGLNIIRGKVGANAMAFIPISQNMYDGQTTLQSRVLLGITYSF